MRPLRMCGCIDLAGKSSQVNQYVFVGWVWIWMTAQFGRLVSKGNKTLVYASKLAW